MQWLVRLPLRKRRTGFPSWLSKAPTQTNAVAFDAASNSGYQTLAASYSWRHICNGSHRFLSVDIALLSAGQTVTGITYDGIAMSLIVARSTVSAVGRVECWGLIHPAVGNNLIEVTLSGAIASAGVAVSRTGVHQYNPLAGPNSNQATNAGSATDATVSIASDADQCVIHAALATDDGDVTAGQTGRNEVNGAGGSGANEDFGPQSPGTKTMSFSDMGVVATWAIAGYALRPNDGVIWNRPFIFQRSRRSGRA